MGLALCLALTSYSCGSLMASHGGAKSFPLAGVPVPMPMCCMTVLAELPYTPIPLYPYILILLYPYSHIAIYSYTPIPLGVSQGRVFG